MRKLISAGFVVGALSACTTTSGSNNYAGPPSLLPVSSIVNAVKCELAETFIKRTDLRDKVASDPNKADIKASLQLKNVVVDSRNVGGGFTIPILGIELGPSASFSRGTSTGQTFDVEFSYDVEPATSVPEYCKNPAILAASDDPPELLQVVRVEGDPFVSMLDATVRQYQRLGVGVPRVKLNSLAHTSSFAVETETTGGATAKVIVFSFNAKAGRKLNEAQQLKMVFGLDLGPAVVM